MAKLQDINFKDTRTELEYAVFESEYYDKPTHTEWVGVNLTFNFGEAFSQISTESHGQEFDHVELLISDLRKLISGKVDFVNFEPLEPDYNLVIKHSGRGKYEKEDRYETWCIIDASNANGHGYWASGPAIYMDVNKAGLQSFANNLERDLKLQKYKQTRKRTRAK